MPARQNLELSNVLDPAMEIVAEAGFGALTLRPLARRINSSVSVLTYRFGAKDDLLRHLIEAARAEDQTFFDIWRRRLQSATAFTGVELAESGAAVLSDWAGPHRRRALFFSELIQASAHQPLWAMLAPWCADRLEFWRELSDRLEPRPPFDLALALQAYCIDEGAHALALEPNGAYVWLRRLSLRRLCCGIAADRDGAGDQALFAAFCEELGELPDDLGVDVEPSPENPKLASVVSHMSALIVEAGVDALTHRALAARAGVASSTLAYHFRTQEDLVKAGLEDIVRRLRTEIDAQVSAIAASEEASSQTSYTGLEIVRATFAVALAATRMPRMLACAGDMRRLRGVNISKVLQARLGDLRADALAAQALSVTISGQMMLSGHEGAAAATEAGQNVAAQLSNWMSEKLS